MKKKTILKLLLIVTGAYVVYFITGTLLVENKIVKEWWIAPKTVLADQQHDADNSRADVDGPYIFYRDGKVFSYGIGMDDGKLVVHKDSFPDNETGRSKVRISCSFPTCREFDFSTQLQSSLQPGDDIFPMPDRLLAISDIEGNFEAFHALLVSNGVIDRQFNWTFGDGHLVLNGDFFDRGHNVTECLWLIYALEQKALQSNGKVHFILGNHEIMNLGGDIRYVARKYKLNAQLMGMDYAQLYTLNTELGRWLGTKNIVEQIGDYLFTHGGFSEEYNDLQLPLHTVNEQCRKHLFTPARVKKELTGSLGVLFGSKMSPFWYRDYIEENAEEEEIDYTLKMYDAKRIVVGHTVVKDIRTFYNGKVIAIDTKHAYGIVRALLIENGRIFSVNEKGEKKNVR